MIRDETTRAVAQLPQAERELIQERAQGSDMSWGHFWNELKFPRGPAFDNLSLAEVAKLEATALKAVFGRALS